MVKFMTRKTKAIDDKLLSLRQAELKRQGIRSENGRRLRLCFMNQNLDAFTHFSGN